MTPDLLGYLCDPIDKSSLTLTEAQYGERIHIVRGILISSPGGVIPFETEFPGLNRTVNKRMRFFGDEWNRLNFADFHLNWPNHTVKNTFGSPDAFRGKVVAHGGAGSGMKSRWMKESEGARVIPRELSHSVEGIMKDLQVLDAVNVIQCSIDHPPLRDGAIDGVMICHHVIQQTPMVERTQRAL